MSAVASGPEGSCPGEKGKCPVTSYMFSINFLRLLVSLTIPFNNLVKLFAVLACRRFDHTPKQTHVCSHGYLYVFCLLLPLGYVVGGE